MTTFVLVCLLYYVYMYRSALYSYFVMQIIVVNIAKSDTNSLCRVRKFNWELLVMMYIYLTVLHRLKP